MSKRLRAKEVVRILASARLAMQKCLSIQLIGQERLRQIDRYGWTPAHDDSHVNGELTRAAIGYAMFGLWRAIDPDGTDVVPGEVPSEFENEWPWDERWWKPSDDPVRNLVKAGALIAAEIDRLVRLEAQREPAD